MSIGTSTGTPILVKCTKTIITGDLNIQIPSKPVTVLILTLHPLKEKTLPHYIFEEFIFNFKYVRLYDADIPKEKWLNYLQILRHLIWVCTVCQSPFRGLQSSMGKSANNVLKLTVIFLEKIR